jgi:hypothetical protein
MPEKKRLEYIAIAVVQGAVHSITPSTPQTEALLASSGQAVKVDIGFAVNKLARHGYRLGCPAPVALGEVHPASASYILFMERNK